MTAPQWSDSKRLWSLWDIMLRLPLPIMMRIATLTGGKYPTLLKSTQFNGEFSEEDRKAFKELYEDNLRLFVDLDLTASAATVKKCSPA
ncbi:MAG: hypothetical protein ACLPJJ_00120 [Acidocella sp.]|uniref:hypothetical protein n=1 Tax=Acidocella sp. TaxID=50710 RepID=UPI003FD74E58